ncbi:hypothetical protein B0H14DRAFT_2617435 [Mycena olivaceomarginata]|nr:hypothetical protein B0H14DRAFT_2617435 [Mycena olivaceomarginata]
MHLTSMQSPTKTREITFMPLCARKLSKDKMEYIAQCVQATLEVAAVPGVTFDGAVEDTIRRAVRTVLASFPTPLVDSRSRERVRLTLKLVWIGNEETGTSSGPDFLHLASSANTVFAPPEAKSPKVCRAWAEGADEIPPALITAAARRDDVNTAGAKSLYRNSPAAGNGPFAGLMRISPEGLAPTESVHHDAVHDTQRRDTADEYGVRNIAGRLHAKGDNDSVNVSASAELRVRAAQSERGPKYSPAVDALSQRCRGGESASQMIRSGRCRYLKGEERMKVSESRRPENGPHPAAVKACQAPVIRCGMARIVSSADSDVADSKRRERGGRECTKKGKTGAHTPTEARGKSPSARQYDEVHPFKRERSKVPQGGWFAQWISEPPPSLQNAVAALRAAPTKRQLSPLNLKLWNVFLPLPPRLEPAHGAEHAHLGVREEQRPYDEGGEERREGRGARWWRREGGTPGEGRGGVAQRGPELDQSTEHLLRRSGARRRHRDHYRAVPLRIGSITIEPSPTAKLVMGNKLTFRNHVEPRGEAYAVI